MKMKHLLWAVAPMALALSACQSDEPSNKGGNSSFTGDGYMAVNITLPAGSDTRAANDDFNHGLANEYKVNNAAIALFTGKDTEAETGYKFVAVYTLNPDEVSGDETVTTQLAKTFKVNDVTLADGESIYAMALVNYEGVLTINGNDLQHGAVSMTGKTFADLLAFTSDNNFIGAKKDNFFMTNAVMSSTVGGATSPLNEGKADIFTLVKCNDNCIKPTPGEAEANPACVINVERATAKATMSTEGATVTITDGQGGEALTISSVEWILDNTQNNSFIVRNMAKTGVEPDTYLDYFSQYCTDTNKYRMVGHKTGLQTYYRTYWCVDPSYDVEYSAANFTMNKDNASVAFGATGDANPQYCHENTFDVNHMTWNNTTRAILKVTYALPAGSEALYVRNGINNIAYSDADNTGIKSAFLGSKKLQDAYAALITGDAELKDKFIFTYKTVNGLQKVGQIIMKVEGMENVYLYTNDESGISANGIVKGEGDTAETLFSAEEVKALVARSEENNEVTVYVGGVAYYQVRIKHFGDDLTPWDADGSVTSTDNIENTYGSDNAEKNFLGRYGMVRNNWYEIKIQQFKRMGDATFPDVSNNPDDQKDDDKFMSVRINVLSWAKRTQTEIL